MSAVGHETDVPLVDFVADVRASTPTDAAKRIVPDLADEFRLIGQAKQRPDRALRGMLDREQHRLDAIRSRPVDRPAAEHDRQPGGGRDALRDRAARNLGHRLDRAGTELAHTLARLRTLSPAATLQRGYAIVQRADGAVVRAAGDVAAGDAVRIRLAEGELAATVDRRSEPSRSVALCRRPAEAGRSRGPRPAAVSQE